MPVLEFFPSAGRDQDNIQANSCRLLNCYREPVSEGGRTGFVMKSVPGATEFADLGRLFVRDMQVIGGTLYVYTGGNLSRVNDIGTQFVLGTVANAADGQIFGRPEEVSVVGGGDYWLWNGTTLSQPAHGAFSSVGSGAFITGYTVLGEKDGDRLTWSDPYDAATIPAINVGRAGDDGEPIKRIVPVNGRLWVMKESSTVFWYVTGQANENALAPIPGGTISLGLKADKLVTPVPGGMVFVGSDNVAYYTAGEGVQRISFPPVETSLANSKPARCFYYEDEGSKFVVIQFPNRPAWVCDIASPRFEWHERANGASLARWDAVASAEFRGTWYVGRENGKIASLGQTYKDGEAPLIREAVSATFMLPTREDFGVSLIEIMGRVAPNEQEFIPQQTDLALWNDGEPDPIIDGDEYVDADTLLQNWTRRIREPQVYMALSRDNGLSWGPQKVLNMGGVGEYDRRVTKRQQGQFRQMTMRLRWSDPVNLAINTRCNLEIA